MTSAERPRRSCLTVPGSSERFLAKARTLAPDELILDLEDAVEPTAKDTARTAISDLTGLQADATGVAALGFDGKWVVHPSQRQRPSLRPA